MEETVSIGQGNLYPRNYVSRSYCSLSGLPTRAAVTVVSLFNFSFKQSHNGVVTVVYSALYHLRPTVIQ